MGIRNLSVILGKNAQAYTPKTFADYASKTIAVDAPVYMYKYKSIYGDQWIGSFYNFIKSLSMMKCVFVFDSKVCVEEKVNERAKRNTRKKQLRIKITELETAVDNYKKTGTIAECLYAFRPANENYVRLTRPYSTETLSIPQIEEYISKTKNHLLPIYSEDFETVKNICRSSGIAVLDAEMMEAEKLCALLCHEKKVDAVMTEDTDAMGYLAPKIMCRVSGTRFSEVDMSSVLQQLDMTSAQFIDMCILCGTDYGPSIPGIGPVRAHRIMKTYGSIENAATDSKLDTSIINYERIREIFSVVPSGIPELEFPQVDASTLETLFSSHSITPRKLQRLL